VKVRVYNNNECRKGDQSHFLGFVWWHGYYADAYENDFRAAYESN
jgi:hypothetical protein